MPTMTQLGAFIAHRRAELGLSLAELARRCARSKSYIHQLETGAFDNPTADVIADLARGLQVLPAELHRALGTDIGTADAAVFLARLPTEVVTILQEVGHWSEAEKQGLLAALLALRANRQSRQ